MDEPKRRFTIEIEVGGDTLDDAISMVMHFVANIRAGSRSCLSGGYDRCGSMKVVERPDVTHETYTAALMKWIEHLDASTADAVSGAERGGQEA